MTKIAFAPTRIKWIASRGLYHLPFFSGIMNKRDNDNLLAFAQISAEKERKHFVKDSGWARKAFFNDVPIRDKLLEIDKTMGLELGNNIFQSEHWSRIYEYPYAVHQLQQLQTGRILDCGAGLNPLQFYLAEQGFEVHSLDSDLNVLKKLNCLKWKFELENIKPAFGNLLNLPYPDEYFEAVICISVLEHALMTSDENTPLLMKGGINEMLRILKPDGVLVLTFDVNFGKTKRRLYWNDYVELCKILNLKTESPPSDRLYSSDTKEGLLMGEDLAVYSVTLVKT